MNELAGMLREELRRQDCLEGRIQDMAGAFHDEIKRQEEVVLPDSLAGLEGRLDHFVSSMREEHESVRCTLMGVEAQVSEQMTLQSKASDDLEERINAEIKARLNAETETRFAEVAAVRDVVNSLQITVRDW